MSSSVRAVRPLKASHEVTQDKEPKKSIVLKTEHKTSQGANLGVQILFPQEINSLT